MIPCIKCGIHHKGKCADFDFVVWQEYLRIEKVLKRKWRFDIMKMSLFQAKRFFLNRKRGKKGSKTRKENMTAAVKRAMGGDET